MKPEKEFDKILQQRIEESEGDFPFDESNWQKASKLIDDERGVAGYYNNKRYLLLGALFLVLGSLGFFTYTYLNSGNTAMVSASRKNNSLNEKQNNVNESASIQSNDAEMIAENNQGKTSAGSSSVNESVLHVVAANNSEANASSTPVSTSDKTINGQKSVSDKTYQKQRKNNSLSNGASKSIYKDLSGTNVNTQESQSASSEMENEYSGSNMYENLYLNTKLAKMPSHNLDADIRKTSYDFIRIYRDDYFTSRKRKTFYLDAEAGTTYLLGWNAPKGKDAKGFNAYAGLNFGFHIKKKFSASIGAQVYNISNIQQPFYTASSLNYDFGSNGTYTTIATNSLLYAAIPVKINYAINKRNSINAGVNTALLFNGMNTIETFNMTDAVKSNSKIIHNTGYYEGTNTINIMITAGYSRAVTRRIKVNGEFMYGLSDVYKNRNSNTTKENNMGVRLGLQYTLFDK
ncbi:MAG: hypothetical protein ACXVC7_04080 [Bacteroidia bacterium]